MAFLEVLRRLTHDSEAREKMRPYFDDPRAEIVKSMFVGLSLSTERPTTALEPVFPRDSL